MRRLILFVIVLFSFFSPFFAFAHSGGTDTRGGHRSPTGYHYHHGYPAHAHDHGICTLEDDYEEQLHRKLVSSLQMSGIGAVGFVLSLFVSYLYSKQSERLVDEAKRRGETYRPSEPSWPMALSIVSLLAIGAGLYGYFVG